MTDLHSPSIERLYQAILNLKNPEECSAFFEDICTIQELTNMAQRLDTAILLDEGNSYAAIAETVGTSSATISRVNRCLLYGSGGYRRALDSLKKTEE